MKRIVLAGLLVAVVTALAGGSYALARGDRGGGFHARLDGWQEVPSQVTTGHGRFRAKVVGEAIEYRLAYEGLEGDALAAHIHIGSRHENGNISAFLCGGGGKPACPARAGEVTGVIAPTDVTGPASQGVEPANMSDLLRALRRGETYVNVHTDQRAPGGEIRGQIHGGRRGDR